MDIRRLVDVLLIAALLAGVLAGLSGGLGSDPLVVTAGPVVPTEYTDLYAFLESKLKATDTYLSSR